MDEKTMKATAKACESCVDWLPICKSVCCRMFVLYDVNPNKVFRGGLFSYHSKNLKPNLKWYYKLHGARLVRNRLSFVLNDFKLIGTTLFVLNKCSLLTDEGLCEGHPEKKPFVCKDFTTETYGTGRYYDPPNCLFKFKK